MNVVAFTKDRELIMVRQYRQGAEAVTLEIPGGALDAGEDPAAAARRELREETGYSATEVVPLGSVNPNPALFTNRCSTGEDIEVTLIPWSKVDDHVRGGAIDHSLVITALYLHQLHTTSEEE